MATDIRELEASVRTVTPTTPIEQAAIVIGAVEWMERWIREVRKELDERLLEKVLTEGEFVIGDCRFYAGTARSVKCKDNAATAQEILTAVKGDWQRFADCMSANAWKYGTVHRLFEEVGSPDIYGACFETVETDKLETGKPRKKLMKADQRFLQRQ